ncbi:cytochrome P450 [Salimicrobium halophilum]|uniref:Fatty-acid peroxygenase n=1 Tax=Salimicrobium halophilum TaxID=86666 RepID=A0A1G8TXF5_9BACI|nr:cytochrome P450 [Salimicrobium halophilum]SDJ46173.1 fatty-acid peroxygenase [Salimicrobium halophilum]
MTNDDSLPKDKGFDRSLQMLKEGYTFIRNRENKYHSPVFETKLLGEKTYCMVGEEAAKVFYDNGKFRRQDAAPKAVEKTLFGEGGVQGLDGEDHRQRKEMFMSLMTKDSLDDIQSITTGVWKKYVNRWKDREKVTLYDESKKMMAETALTWAGIPFEEKDVDEWAKELSDLFEKAADVSISHFLSRRSRSKAEAWIEELVDEIRKGERKVRETTPLFKVSFHKDKNGELLELHTAAVEILNLIRPITAVSVYITFLGLALHDFPVAAEEVKEGGEEERKRFIQEVRRYYPFFPFVIARVDKDFTYHGASFEEGTLTLLDLYGTNHHPDSWSKPDSFQPDRFHNWFGSPFDFIPQGGGDHEKGHRCAGEWITLRILNESLRVLTDSITYHLPEQNLKYELNDIPSLPKSGIELEYVKKKG